MRTANTQYSASKYVDVSTKVCEFLKAHTLLAIVKEVNRRVENGLAFDMCLADHDAGRAASENQPLQVLFGQFAAFARDKACFPHMLFWPVVHLAGVRASEDFIGLFSRQSPMFIDRADNETIVPVLRQGLDEAAVIDRFQDFYSGHALYDFTKQWIARPGPFSYDFRWLRPDGAREEIKGWADPIFPRVYGISPDDFTILPS